MPEEHDTVLLDSEDAVESDQRLRESSKMNVTLMEQEEQSRSWLIRFGPLLITGVALIVLGSYLWIW
ncbi:hypothetical protein [Alkalicoccobacillus plakortidis]|uniref:Uncharacterized protein n=1 Tax=Alkalicoccobacillus plakortidis TaxID=444060 RepID=A0ABT0XMK1_9BACI|nr:hypothetical protein [Alkalicoccobacillus plakortidis]MCM2677135.1 hypothetical protein [Alkalicoccobacillus plakortidis]